MSAINAAFFRSMRDVVAGADESNIDIMINSIFDAGNVFTWKTIPLLCCWAPHCSLAYGMVYILMLSKGRYRIFWTALSVLLALAVDALIAYKIDRGIHDLRVMMNMADEGWKWYASINFYLVLAFGFGGYMVWGLLYEAAIAEKGKKNVEVRGKVLIDALKTRSGNWLKRSRNSGSVPLGLRMKWTACAWRSGKWQEAWREHWSTRSSCYNIMKRSTMAGWGMLTSCRIKKQMRASCEEVLLGCRQSIEKALIIKYISPWER